MNISCTQENLNQGLFVVSHIASKSTTLPILQNVLLRAKENAIQLSATNLEIGITCQIRGKVEEEGEVAVQAKLFGDYINLLPKERVDILLPTDAEAAGFTITINCNNQKTKVKGQAAAEFPYIPKLERSAGCAVDPLAFRQAISQVIFSVSQSETRPELNGVYLKLGGGSLTLAATDSYRLAERVIPLTADATKTIREVIVPARALQELQRILSGFKDPAQIADMSKIELVVSDNQIAFLFGGVELTSRLIEGKYPEYQQIIPTQSSTTVEVGAAALVTAVKTASLFARSGIYDVNLEVASDAGGLVVSSTSSQVGENTSKLEADVTGGPVNIVLNYRYLLDGLQNTDADVVRIYIVDAGSPVVLKSKTDKPDYLYLIMPIQPEAAAGATKE